MEKFLTRTFSPFAQFKAILLAATKGFVRPTKTIKLAWQNLWGIKAIGKNTFVSRFVFLITCFIGINAYSQTTVNLPTSGAATANPAGNNITIFDNGGSGSNYSNNVSGYIVLNCNAGQTISIYGLYYTESGYDYLNVYTGSGTGGTQVTHASGSGWYSYTGASGTALTVQLTSDGSNVSNGLYLLVTYSTTPTLNVPTGTNNSVTCGTSTVLFPNNGSASNYSNSDNGYTVLNCSGSGQVSINGIYNCESGYDYVKIYSGSGTGGTLLGSYNGSGNISITGAVGTPLTVQFTSDASVNYSGFALYAKYIANCCTNPNVTGLTASGAATCTGSGATVTVSSPTSNLASGTYTVTYNVSGTSTVASTTASMVFTAGSPGTGTFTTSALTGTGTNNLVQITNLYITATPTCNTTLSYTAPAFTTTAPSTAPTAITGGGTLCTSGTLTESGGALATSATYQWGTGSTIGTSPISGATASTYSATATNTYWVSVTGPAPCNGASNAGATTSVTINTPSTAPSSITGGGALCTSGVLTESGGALGTSATYQWGTGSTVGTNPISGATASTYTATATNTYWVSVTGPAPCNGVSNSAATTSVTISTPSTAPSSITGGGTLCVSGVLTESGGALGTGANYQWGTGSTIGTSPITGATASTYTATATNTYWVSVTGPAPCNGLSNSAATTTVIINTTETLPTLAVSATGYTATTVNTANDAITVCPAATVTITPTGGNGSFVYYIGDNTDQLIEWKLMNGVTQAGAFTQAFSNPGYYLIEVFATNACGTTTGNNYAQVEVAPVQAPVVTPSQTICSGTAPSTVLSGSAGSLGIGGFGTGTTAITYQWQQSTDNGQTWSNATGTSTSSSYTAPSLTQTTLYKRQVITTGPSACTVTQDGELVTWSATSTGAAAGVYSGVYSLIKLVGGTAAWSPNNAWGITTEQITNNGGYVSAVMEDNNYYQMLGLFSTNVTPPAPDYATNGTTATAMPYAIYPQANGTILIFENGAQVGGSYGAYSIGDVLKVAVVNNKVLYYQNSTLLYTSLVTPTLPYYGVATIYSPSGGFKLVRVLNPVKITVNATSTAPTSISGGPTLCTSGTLTESGGTLSAGATYQWGTGSTIGTSPISGATASTYTATAANTYWVSVTAGTTCPGVSNAGATTAIAAINSPSTAPTSISGGAGTYCGVTVLTEVGGALATGANYQWGTGSTVGTSPIAGATSSTYSATATNTYWVSVTGPSPCNGASNSGATTSVTITATTYNSGGFYYSTSPTFTPPTQGIRVGSTGAVSPLGAVSLAVSNGTGTPINPCTTYYYTTWVVVNGTTDTIYANSPGGTGGYKSFTTPSAGSGDATLVLASGSASTSVCQGGSMTPITYNVGGAGYGATITAGALPTGVSLTYVANAYNNGGVATISGIPTATPGTYNFTIGTTVNSPCSQVTLTGSIIVGTQPTLTGVTPTSICPGGTVTTGISTGTGVSGATYTYSWTQGGVTQSSTTSSFTTSTGLASGQNYTYAVTATSSATGCVASASQLVSVANQPTLASITPTGICPGATLSTSIASGGATGATYIYSWNNGSTNVQNGASASYTTPSNLTAPSTQTYNVTATSSATNCTATILSQSVTVSTAASLSAITPGNICPGGTLSTVLSGGVSGTGPSYTYSWTQGGVTQSSTASSFTTSTGLSTGSYTYAVTATSASTGCVASVSTNVTVAGQPTLQITPAAMCPGANVNVSITSGGASGAAYTYSWTQDGTTEPSNTSSYNTTTTLSVSNHIYDVTATSSVTNCVASVTATVAVDAQPTIAAITPTSICPGGTLSTSVLSGGVPGDVYTYSWTQAGTTVQNTTSASYTSLTSLSSGAYTYAVTAYDLTTGCGASQSASVTVATQASLSAISPTTICAGNAISTTLSNGVTGLSYTYSWTQAGTTVQNTSSASYTTSSGLASGSYTYAVTATSSSPYACTASTSTSVSITPNASIASVTGSSPICISGTTTYLANTVVTSGGTGAWSSDNTAVATVNSSGVVTGVTAGTANIIYTVTGGCGGTATKSANITISPNASIASVTGTSPICISGTTTYLANTVVTSGGTGAWSSDNTAVATVNSSGVVTGVTAGTANIKYTVTGGCGGTATKSASITISPNASIGSVTGTSGLCLGGSATYTANSVVTSGGTGAWSSNNTSVATVNSSGLVTVVAVGSANIIYTVTGGCGGTTSAFQGVTIYPNVSNYGTITASAGTTQSLCPSVAPAGTFNVTGASGGSGSFNYQWYYQAGLISAPSGSTIGSWLACAEGVQGNNCTSANFQPFGTTSNISYACLVTPASAPSCVGSATWATGVLQLTVSTPTASIAITTGNSSMCNGGTVTLTASTSFVATWQWYSSSDNITYAPVSGQTATTFSPSTSSNGLVYYDAIATYTTGSGCSPATSNDEAITVVAQPSITTQPSGAILCLGGSGSLNVVVTGGVGPTYQWQYHSGISNTNVSDNTVPGTGYTYGGTGTSNPLVVTTSHSATATTYQYRVQVAFLAGSGCTAVNSSNGSLQVAALPSITSQPASTLTVCAGNSGNLIIGTGGGISLSEEWQYYNSGTSTWGDVANNTPLGVNYSGGTTFTISTNNGSTTPGGNYQYRCIVNSTGDNCTPVTSNTSTVTVNPVMAISSVTGTSPLCIGGSATYTTSGVVLGGGGSGAWSSDNTSIATVNTSGVVTAVAAGTCNIIYTVSGGCGSTVSAQQSLTVNPNASIASVTGTSPLCVGGTATFSANSVVLGGGTGAWSSSNTSIATVNSSGVVTAVAVGSCNIKYTITGGCAGTATAQQSLTVNPGASIGSVTGSSPICISGTTTYSANSVVLGGGTGAWSSSNTSVATVNSSGVVTGVAAGSANIIYTVSSGCGGTATAQQSVTISPNASVGSVTGSTPICISGSTTYSANSIVLSGGTGAWSSSNTSIATVNSSGVVTGVAAGSANIIYTVSSGCGGTATAQQSVTISPNASVGSVTGSSPICISGSTTYSANSIVLSGGTGAWSSDNTSVATVNSSGVVTGVAAGSADIIYTITGGCGGTVSAQQTLTISPSASIGSVTGSSPICIGGTTTFTANAPVLSGGTGSWSSSSTAVATVDASGVVTGVAAGNANIIYTITGGCGGTVSALQALTVSPGASIASVTGSSPLCISATTTFTANSVVLSGGTGSWSSSNTAIATVDASGVVTGVSAGTANIRYKITGGCGGTVSALQSVTISPDASIASVSGSSPVCIAGTTTYTANSPVYSGGTGNWSSSNTSIATVNSSGVVTGVAAGSANIIYTISGGCGGTVSALQAVTINPNASIASVTGSSPICISGTTTYNANSVVLGGGTGAWSSDNTSVATVNSSSGIVTGVAAGSANIIYAITGGCGGTVSAQQAITVSPGASIASVTGSTPLCISGTATYAANTVVLSGGTGAWSSDNTSVVTVNSSGVVTGVAAGSANIIYTVTGGCGGTVSAQQAITINPGASIASVTGASLVCVSSNTNFTANSVVLGGGTGAWSSSNTSIATVTSSGVVSGVAGGSANIVYTITGGCGGTVSAQQAITVNQGASIASVSGSSPVCIGSTTTYTANSVVLGGGIGAWSSDNTSIANVNSSGVVSGVGAGTANIIYTISGGCGGTVSAQHSVTVSPNTTIASVTGNSPLCVGSTTTYAANTVVLSGGTGAWSSDNTSNATVNSSGVVTGVATGSANIIYTITGGCGGTISSAQAISVGSAAVTSSAGFNPSICGGSDGYITLTGLSATTSYSVTYNKNSSPLGPFSFTSDGSGVLTITALTAGSYNNIIVTNGSCSSTPVPSSGNITISNPAAPTVYVVTGGTHCGSTTVGLAFSQSGYNYQLLRNGGNVSGGIVAGDAGNGAITFGAQTTAGTYTVVTTACPVTMSGNAVVNASPAIYAVTGGANCGGSAVVGLSGSDNGVNYQLLLSGSTNIGGAVAGTGSALNFGTQTGAGSYTVLATDATTLCTSLTTTSASVYGTANVYDVTSTSNCSSITVSLSNSDLGVSYALMLGGSTQVGSTVSGTGNMITFPAASTSGTYTVQASAGTCNTNMNSSGVLVSTAPTQETVTGGLGNCGSATIGLNASQVNISYQLIINGNSNVGTPVMGTGLSGGISFGTEFQQGTYTVIATSTTNCVATMLGSASITSGALLMVAPAIVPGVSSPVCQGSNVNATFTTGSGGTSAALETHEYSTNGGNSWSTYTPGNNISTTGITGVNIVQIRTQRYDPTSTCYVSAYRYAYWTVGSSSTAASSVSVSPSASPVCSGTNNTLTFTVNGGSLGSNARWVLYNTNPTSGNPTPVTSSATSTLTTSQPLAAGTYTYYVRAESFGTCVTAAVSTGLTVLQSPDVLINTNDATSICTGGTVSLHLSSNDPNVTGFTWTVGSITGGVTGATAGSGTTISEAPVDLGSTYNFGSVTYVITAHEATTPTCPSIVDNQVISLNRQVVLTSPATVKTCNNDVIYTPASNISGATYSWSRPVVSGITPATTASGSGNINDTVTNTTTAPITYDYTITITSGCGNVNATVSATINPALGTATPTIYVDQCGGGSELGLSTLTGGNGVPNYTVYFTDETYNIHYTDVITSLPITLATPAYGDVYSIDSIRDADQCEVILGGTITAQAPVLDDSSANIPCNVSTTPTTFYNTQQLGNGNGVNAAFVVKIAPSNNINLTSSDLGVFATSPTYGGTQHFMRRNVNITPGTQSDAYVTIYISQTDVDSLVAESANDPFPNKPLLSDLSNLGVSRFDGGDGINPPAPDNFSSRNNFHHTTVTVTPNDPLPGVYAVTFHTPGFSDMQMNSDPSVAGEISGTATTCPGQATPVAVSLFGIGPWSFQIVDQNGNVITTVTNYGTSGATSDNTYSFNVSPSVNTTYTLANLTDADYPDDMPPYYKGSAVITVNTSSTVSVSGGATICQNGSVTLTGTSTSPGSVTGYTWYNTSNLTNALGTGQTFSPPTGTVGTANYVVVVTYTSGSGICSPATSTPAAVVVNAPLALTGPTASTQTVCTGNSQTSSSISVSPSGGAGTVSYQWYSNTTGANTGGTSISGATTSTYSPPYSTTGTAYYYAQAWTAVSGCTTPVSSSGYSTVIVDGLTATAGNGGPYCSAGSIALTSTPSSNAQGTLGYAWSNAGGDGFTASTQNATDNLSNGGGTYQVVVHDDNCSVTATTTVTLNSNLINNFTPTVGANPVCITSTGGGTTIDVAGSQTMVSYQLETSSGTTIGSPVTGSGNTLNLATGPVTANTSYKVVATSGTCSYTSPTTAVVAVSPDIALGALLPSSSQPLIGQHYNFAALPTGWSAITNSNSNAWTLGNTNNANSNSYSYYNISGLSNNPSTAGYVQTPVTTTIPAGTVDLISNTFSTSGFTNISVQWAAQRYAGYNSTVNLYYTTDATINGGTVWTLVSYLDVQNNVTGNPWYLVNNGVPVKLPHDSHNDANNAATLTFKWSAPVATDGSSYYAINDVGIYGLGKLTNCGDVSVPVNYISSSCNASQYNAGTSTTSWTSGSNTTTWPSWTGFTPITNATPITSHGVINMTIPANTTTGTYDVDFSVNDGLSHNSATISFPVTTDPPITVAITLDNCSCNNTGGAFGNVVTTYAAGGTGTFTFSPSTIGDALKTAGSVKGVFWSAADGGAHYYTVADGQCSTVAKLHTQNGAPTNVPFGSVTGQPIAVGGNGLNGSFNNSGEGDPSITHVNGPALTCHQTADFGNTWVTYQVNNLDNGGNLVAGDTTNNTAVVEINNHGVNLDSVSVSVYRDAYLPAIPNAATQTTACYGYVGYAMERHFMIKSTQSTGANVFVENPVGVRLYFTNAEFEDLKYWTMYAATHATGESAGCAYADTVTNMNSIYVTKYTGANEDGNYLNNSQAPSGVYRIFGKTAALPGNGPLAAIDAPGAALQTGQGTNLHYVQMNVTEFSEFWLGGSQDGFALPVEMIYLEAEAMNNDSIQVRWATATEINNREFNVERSTDGNNWTTIGIVGGHGNSTVDNYYVYNDLNVVPEVRYYYRLKQIDNNGSYQYTDVVQAMINGTGAFAVMNFVPNPTSGNTQLTVVTTRNQEITVDFYDMLGQKVMSTTEQIVAGTNRINFDLHRFAAGTYSAIVTSENQLYTKKIVITGR